MDYPGRNFELEANSIEKAELWVKNLNIFKIHIEGQKPQIKDRTMSLKISTVGSGKKDYKKLSESTLVIYDKNKNSSIKI